MASLYWIFKFVYSSGSGIGRFTTTAVKILNDGGITVVTLLDVDGDATTNFTAMVITAIDTCEDTAGDSQGDVATDISIVGTTKDGFNLIVFRTA